MKVVVEELASKALDLRGKGGAEHQGLPVHLGRHAWDVDGAADVGHETLGQSRLGEWFDCMTTLLPQGC